jgi:hypothetical protein
MCCVIGCSKSASDGTAATSRGSVSTDAITKAASDFLDAIQKGDTSRASARLTPQAMQQIVASGKQFAPPGLANAKFHIREIRSPSVDQAFVLCELINETPGVPPTSEEMCWVMRSVGSDWMISGIAYANGPNQQWIFSNFETGQNIPVTLPSSSPGTTGPAPARMAQESASTSPR